MMMKSGDLNTGALVVFLGILSNYCECVGCVLWYVIILLFMEKPFSKKQPSSVERDEKRLTTAPIRERPKYSEMYKTNNLQLPIIRGKNPLGREPVVASRDYKRNQIAKREEVSKPESEAYEQIHKRPQTSKGSRNTAKKQSQYYQQGEDDLVITSMQDKLQLFKKGSKEHHSKHP